MGELEKAKLEMGSLQGRVKSAEAQTGEESKQVGKLVQKLKEMGSACDKLKASEEQLKMKLAEGEKRGVGELEKTKLQVRAAEGKVNDLQQKLALGERELIASLQKHAATEGQMKVELAEKASELKKAQLAMKSLQKRAEEVGKRWVEARARVESALEKLEPKTPLKAEETEVQQRAAESLCKMATAALEPVVTTNSTKK